ncbi:MAG: energy transducer TonB [Lewinellaceae bacterium]|nr:energy transducer TonB [Lewinellaceae bacterium]
MLLTNLTFSSSQLLLALATLVVVVLAIIYFGRRHFSKVSNLDLTTKYKGKHWASPLTARNKYPDVDVFKMQPYFFRLGLIGALALTLAAFNWTSMEKKQKAENYDFVLDVDVEIDIPRSAEPPPPPPPPPPPLIQEVPEGLVLEEDEVEFVDQSVEANTEIEAPPVMAQNTKKDVPPPPPPPPMRRDEAKEIFMVVEEMPRFPGCEDKKTEAERKACSEQTLMAFVYDNIRYPAIARENGISGTVVVSFVVNQDGRVSDIETVRDIGGGCGEEAARIVELMNSMAKPWIPGKQRGRAVRVKFTMPIRFKLQYN